MLDRKGKRDDDDDADDNSNHTMEGDGEGGVGHRSVNADFVPVAPLPSFPCLLPQ